MNLAIRWARVGVSTAMVVLFTTTVRPAAGADVIIRPQEAQQRIDGFGASSAWTAAGLNPADADLAFSADSGVGLSLLRVRIRPCDSTTPSCVLTTDELATAQLAQARHAQVWATPWTPPVDWKVNATPEAGLDNGNLAPAHADDWANALVAFVQSMKSQGVNLLGVSAQNEPDMKATNYESCSYRAADLADFIGNHLGPAFDKAGLLAVLPFKIIGPETLGWLDFPTYGSAILANGSSYVGTIATHAYNGSPPGIPTTASQAVIAAGKAFWQTEVSVPLSVARLPDLGMTSGLWVAQNIHDSLVANVNAWHYWWLKPQSPDNGALWDKGTGAPTKRLYVMGNYSKFVRPGFHRVTATSAANPGVSVSAYYELPSSNPPSGKLVVVAINSNTAPVSQTFHFDGVSTGSWTAWVTSKDADLLPQSDAFPDGTQQVVYQLPAESVTTLQGTVTGAGPAYVPPAPDAGRNGSGSAADASASPGGSSSGLACSAGGHMHSEAGTRGAVAAGSLLAFLAVRRRARRRRPSGAVIATW
jgi:glucuronoarabinoxylan endo-1,4-beta-xylanase